MAYGSEVDVKPLLQKIITAVSSSFNSCVCFLLAYKECEIKNITAKFSWIMEVPIPMHKRNLNTEEKIIQIILFSFAVNW